jgi:hypothetical protein
VLQLVLLMWLPPLLLLLSRYTQCSLRSDLVVALYLLYSCVIDERSRIIWDPVIPAICLSIHVHSLHIGHVDRGVHSVVKLGRMRYL